MAQRSPYPQRSSLFCSTTGIDLPQGKCASPLSWYFRSLQWSWLTASLYQTGGETSWCVQGIAHLPACLSSLKGSPIPDHQPAVKIHAWGPWKSKYILDCMALSCPFNQRFSPAASYQTPGVCRLAKSSFSEWSPGKHYNPAFCYFFFPVSKKPTASG